jgi:hypothetical protein
MILAPASKTPEHHYRNRGVVSEISSENLSGSATTRQLVCPGGGVALRRAYNSPGSTIQVGDVDSLAYVVHRRDGDARPLELLFVGSGE